MASVSSAVIASAKRTMRALSGMARSRRLSSAGSIGLDAAQKHLIEGSDWVGVTIGPKAVTDQLLAILRGDQKLAWVVKNDPKAITPQQSATLYERADLVFCNGRERSFLDEARAAGHHIVSLGITW